MKNKMISNQLRDAAWTPVSETVQKAVYKHTPGPWSKMKHLTDDLKLLSPYILAWILYILIYWRML